MLALDDSDETGVVKGALGGLGGSLVLIGADLHAIEIVAGGRHDEGRKMFLLQGVGHGQRVAFMRQRGDLQD